jgi:predicted phosphoribosyltransferase
MPQGIGDAARKRVTRFHDRSDAGRRLAARLLSYASLRPLVLALPRGGAQVGYEVARALGAPLDVLVVRKLGVPGHAELAMGAIASGGTRVLNEEILELLHIPQRIVELVATMEAREVERRERLYRDGKPAVELRGRTVLLVDDGLATGATMRAAIRAARRQGASRVIVAVPVAAREACAELRAEADEVVCSATPEPFVAVGLWYEDFTPTTDEGVRELLERAAREEARERAPQVSAPPR